MALRIRKLKSLLAEMGNVVTGFCLGSLIHNLITIIIMTLFNVGAKHSYVTIKYNEPNLSQLANTTCTQL